MKVVGFNFTKFSGEKIKDIREQLNINTKIDVLEVNQIKNNPFSSKQDLLEIKFNYNVEYKPQVAKVNVEGLVVLSLESKIAKNMVKDWKKKNMSEDIRLFLYNVILRKSSLKALELEDQLNIPLHISMPALRRNQGK